ncbi:Aquaporin-like protein 1 [Elsinoe fawcettii]|nr:Aquaporin-like protein 1 [Elsinoe fawcettii]
MPRRVHGLLDGHSPVKNRELLSDKAEWIRHLVATSSEFVGTFMFLYLAFAGHQMAVGQAAETGPDGSNSSQTVVFISLSYSFSLLVTAWSLYRVSGGLFNPAQNVPWIRGLLFLPTQISAGICAAALIEAMTPGGISTTKTTLGSGMTVVRGLFFEMFLTASLTFTVLMLAAEKSKGTYIAPLGIGLSLFISEIAGVSYTGASLNPARSFGPCVVSTSFEDYHWIYWLGPFMGSAVAAAYYAFNKWLHYEEVNPGQDASDKDEGAK